MPDIMLFVTTNGPTIALELQKRKNIEVILTGGSLNKSVISLSGPIALGSILTPEENMTPQSLHQSVPG